MIVVCSRTMLDEKVWHIKPLPFHLNVSPKAVRAAPRGRQLPHQNTWISYMCSPSGLCATLAAMANARDVISIYLSHQM